MEDQQEYTGERYRELANGAIYDMEVKRIVANPGGGTTAITQANASALAHSRWVQASEAAVEAVGSISPDDWPLSGWKRIVKAQAELSTDIDKGRSSTEAARFVGQATGFLRDRADKEPAGGSAGGVRLEITGDAALRLLEILQRKAESGGK